MRAGNSAIHQGAEKDSKTLLSVVERTDASAVNSPDFDTEGFSEFQFGINLKAGTGGKTITVKVQGKYPGLGFDLYEDLLTSAALDYASPGLKTLKIGQDLTAAANTVAKAKLPKTCRVSVTASDATAGTYGVQVNKLNA